MVILRSIKVARCPGAERPHDRLRRKLPARQVAARGVAASAVVRLLAVGARLCCFVHRAGPPLPRQMPALMFAPAMRIFEACSPHDSSLMVCTGARVNGSKSHATLTAPCAVRPAFMA